MCEDYPCCGHEWGDCEGQKYGTGEDITAYAQRFAELEDMGIFLDEN